MQINPKNPFRLSNNLVWWIKTFIFIGVLYGIYLLVAEKQDKIEDFDKVFSKIFKKQNLSILLFVIILTPINWAFEALKWQKLAQKVEKISFFDAYRGVLIGLTLGSMTPFMLGDYAGKIWMLKTDKRLESIGAIFLGNGFQTFITLIFGAIGYAIFLFLYKDSLWYIHLFNLSIIVLVIVFGVIILSKTESIFVFLNQFKWFYKIKPYTRVLENYNSSDLLRVFAIATSRYCVYAFQFVLLLIVFEIKLPIFVLFSGVCLIFLTKLIALNTFTDLGIRQLISIYFFGQFQTNTLAISSATLLIWLINVLVPMLIGAIFIWQLKISTKTS